MSDFTLSRKSKSDDWATPEKVYSDLNAEFHFNDDPCPLGGITLQDGLSREWGTSVFMNPPYSAPTAWVKKSYEESLRGKTVVGLLRGDTSTAWFHDWVLGKAELRFFRGRIKFNGKPAPFPSIIAIWRLRSPKAGYVKLADDQTLPKNPTDIAEPVNNKEPTVFEVAVSVFGSGYYKAQTDMLKPRTVLINSVSKTIAFRAVEIEEK